MPLIFPWLQVNKNSAVNTFNSALFHTMNISIHSLGRFTLQIEHTSWLHHITCPPPTKKLGVLHVWENIVRRKNDLLNQCCARETVGLRKKVTWWYAYKRALSKIVRVLFRLNQSIPWRPWFHVFTLWFRFVNRNTFLTTQKYWIFFMNSLTTQSFIIRRS